MGKCPKRRKSTRSQPVRTVGSILHQGGVTMEERAVSMEGEWAGLDRTADETEDHRPWADDPGESPARNP
jgi:hypothetical protein